MSSQLNWCNLGICKTKFDLSWLNISFFYYCILNIKIKLKNYLILWWITMLALECSQDSIKRFLQSNSCLIVHVILLLYLLIYFAQTWQCMSGYQLHDCINMHQFAKNLLLSPVNILELELLSIERIK